MSPKEYEDFLTQQIYIYSSMSISLFFMISYFIIFMMILKVEIVFRLLAK